VPPAFQLNVTDESENVVPGTGLVISGCALAVAGRNIIAQPNKTIKTYTTDLILFTLYSFCFGIEVYLFNRYLAQNYFKVNPVMLNKVMFA
jgi:hypothetical protein